MGRQRSPWAQADLERVKEAEEEPASAPIGKKGKKVNVLFYRGRGGGGIRVGRLRGEKPPGNARKQKGEGRHLTIGDGGPKRQGRRQGRS